MIKKEYRCFFEGQQEKMYFEHIARKVKEVSPNISLKFNAMEKLLTLERSSTSVPKIAVFDYDMNKVDFENKVKICKNTKVLYTSLNFDLWLLLHKIEFNKNVQSNKSYIKPIRAEYKLEKDANIKSKSNMEKILDQIELEDIKQAIRNSEEIMNGKLEEDKINIKKGFYYYDNPSMNINKFFKQLFEELGV